MLFLTNREHSWMKLKKDHGIPFLLLVAEKITVIIPIYKKPIISRSDCHSKFIHALIQCISFSFLTLSDLTTFRRTTCCCNHCNKHLYICTDSLRAFRWEAITENYWMRCYTASIGWCYLLLLIAECYLTITNLTDQFGLATVHTRCIKYIQKKNSCRRLFLLFHDSSCYYTNFLNHEKIEKVRW